MHTVCGLKTIVANFSTLASSIFTSDHISCLTSTFILTIAIQTTATSFIRTTSGGFTDIIFVPKSIIIRIPVVGVHRSEALRGADAAQFNPKQWLNKLDDTAGARSAEIKGYRHLLMFGYGPRICLGRNFAVTEIKARCFPSPLVCTLEFGLHLLFLPGFQAILLSIHN